MTRSARAPRAAAGILPGARETSYWVRASLLHSAPHCAGQDAQRCTRDACAPSAQAARFHRIVFILQDGIIPNAALEGRRLGLMPALGNAQGRFVRAIKGRRSGPFCPGNRRDRSGFDFASLRFSPWFLTTSRPRPSARTRGVRYYPNTELPKVPPSAFTFTRQASKKYQPNSRLSLFDHPPDDLRCVYPFALGVEIHEDAVG